MSKPHWQVMHEDWMWKLAYEIDQLYRLQDLLLELAYEPVGETVRESIKLLKKRISGLKKAYSKVYGKPPTIKQVAESGRSAYESSDY